MQRSGLMNSRTVVEVIAALIICSLSIPKFARHAFWGLHIWRWFVLIIAIISGSLLSGLLIRIIVFFFERSFNLGKRYLYFAYSVRKTVHNCIWLGLILLAWNFLFNKEVVGETKALSYITKILFCLILATILFLVKTLLFKVLAFSFHVSTYFDRIQIALFNQSIIEILSGPPLVEIQKNMKEKERVANYVQVAATNERTMGRSGGNILKGMRIKNSQIEKSLNLSANAWKDFSKQRLQHDGKVTIEQLLKLNKKNISAWNMKRLMRIVRCGTLTIINEQMLLDKEEDESPMHIMSQHDAMVAARKIFINVANYNRKNIDLNDLEGFFRDDEREKIMCHLGGTPNDGLSKIALKNWVVNAYKCRRALTFALNDVKTIMKRLHQIANILVGIIVICIWLFILNIITTQYFVLVGSQIFLATFISRDTLKKIFKSVKFLFTTHPFDVGDHCEVDDAQMVVEEMNLLTTTFLRFDKSKIVLQNSKLVESSIVNFYQGFDMGDKIDFDVHLSTPLTMIELLRERIILFMERSGHWHSGTRVVVQDIDNTEKKLKISIIMKHRLKFHDMEMKLSRRELVVEELIRVLRELLMMYS